MPDLSDGFRVGCLNCVRTRGEHFTGADGVTHCAPNSLSVYAPSVRLNSVTRAIEIVGGAGGLTDPLACTLCGLSEDAHYVGPYSQRLYCHRPGQSAANGGGRFYTPASPPIETTGAMSLDRVCRVCRQRFGEHFGAMCPDDNLNGTFAPTEPAEYAQVVLPRTLRTRTTRSAPRITGYTYNADVLCVMCAIADFSAGVRTSVDQPTLDEHGIPTDAVDDDGNDVHPIFATDDEPHYDENCGGCATLVREGRLCPCGDGCDRDDCDSCDETDEPDDDDSYESNDCDCDPCIAASEYVGEVE